MSTLFAFTLILLSITAVYNICLHAGIVTVSIYCGQIPLRLDLINVVWGWISSLQIPPELFG